MLPLVYLVIIQEGLVKDFFTCTSKAFYCACSTFLPLLVIRNLKSVLKIVCPTVHFLQLRSLAPNPSSLHMPEKSDSENVHE